MTIQLEHLLVSANEKENKMQKKNINNMKTSMLPSTEFDWFPAMKVKVLIVKTAVFFKPATSKHGV